MSNRNNPRRGDTRRTETGPRYYGSGAWVARQRKKWSTYRRRSERRTGRADKFCIFVSGRPHTKRWYPDE